jgi:predicted Kef-type K+ transport protein
VIPLMLGVGLHFSLKDLLSVRAIAMPSAIVQIGCTANPKIDVIARAHSDAEVEHLKGLGADTVIMGEREIARGIVEEVLTAPKAPSSA